MIDLSEWQKQEYSGMKPGLGRMRRFLKSMGDPQRSFKAVHIAGTNGKGSTAAMIASILREAGYSTGLFTSPHLCKVNERINVNGIDIADKALLRIVKRLQAPAKKSKLSFFEFITAVAFIHFAEQLVDIAVLETGLGGRLDSTNVIKKPLLSVITDIDYDHTAVLGETLGQIAKEKAGIIKHGVPVVCSARRRSATKAVLAKAHGMGAKAFLAARDFNAKPIFTDWARGAQVIGYSGLNWRRQFKFSLLGKYQILNAATALASAEVLNRQGLDITIKSANNGLRKVCWPARFQIVRLGKRIMVIDGAHNPGAIRQFVESWNVSPWKGSKPVIVFGSVSDKDYSQNISILSDIAGSAIVVPLSTTRTASAHELVSVWRKYGIAVKQADSVREALVEVKNAAVSITIGSLFLAGEILNKLHIPSPCLSHKGRG